MKPINLKTAPSSQFASSLFHQAIGSLPAAVAMAIGSTWLCYRILPQGVADTYVPQLWVAFLGVGSISSAVSAARLPERGMKLTEAKIENSKSVNLTGTIGQTAVPQRNLALESMQAYHEEALSNPISPETETQGEAG